MLKKLSQRKKTRAQSLVEYGLILALVSVVAIAVLQLMGNQISTTVSTVNSKLQQANSYSQSQAGP